MRVGFVGWRGMVGSVLMDRLRADDGFSGIESVFFSTSQVGQEAPAEATETQLQDAMSIAALASCDVIVTCQGGDYTKAVYGDLRGSGWNGYWIVKVIFPNVQPIFGFDAFVGHTRAHDFGQAPWSWLRSGRGSHKPWLYPAAGAVHGFPFASEPAVLHQGSTAVHRKEKPVGCARWPGP